MELVRCYWWLEEKLWADRCQFWEFSGVLLQWGLIPLSWELDLQLQFLLPFNPQACKSRISIFLNSMKLLPLRYVIITHSQISVLIIQIKNKTLLDFNEAFACRVCQRCTLTRISIDVFSTYIPSRPLFQLAKKGKRNNIQWFNIAPFM